MKPSLFTALQELEQVVGLELAQAFIDHRKALRKPLIPHAAKLIATKLAKMGNPVAALEKAIEHGWLTVYPEDAPRQAYAAQPRGIDALRADLARRITADELQGPTRAGSLDPQSDRGLPILSWQGIDRPH